MKELTYDVLEDYGIIEEHPSSNRALTLRKVSWAGRQPKIEIREINIETNTPYKGIGFYSDEGLTKFCQLLIEKGLVNIDDLKNIKVDNTSKKKEIISEDELLTIGDD